jgi:signal transduction histidine kinase
MVRLNWPSLVGLIVLLSLLSLPSIADEPPVAIEGLLDLSDWDFHTKGKISLRGEYEFYWRRHLNPRELLTESADYFAVVPRSWNDIEVDDGPAPGHGYATYRLNVLIAPNQPSLSLKTLSFGTAANIYIDGVLVRTSGTPGDSKKTTKASYAPRVIDFQPQGQRVELVFHVSNFDHRLGGIWEELYLGSTEEIHQYADRQIAIELFLFGAILMIAIFNLTFFSLRRDNFANLFLSLFCATAALRIFSTNERFLLRLVPDFNWELLARIEYLSWFLLGPFIAHFLHHLFPREFNRKLVYGFDAVTLIFSLAVIMTPASIYSYSAPVMQILHLGAIFYGVYALLVARHHRREGAKLLLFGYAFFVVCAINDLLYAAGYIQTTSLIDIGIVAFTLCQSGLSSIHFATSVRTVDKQFEQIETARLKLKTQEKLRQEAEVQSRKVSAQFRESQQFEAMGLLVHGVVSDLKVSFNEASKEADVLSKALESEPTLLASLEKTRRTADRSLAVIEDLLSLSNFDNEADSADANQVVTEVLASGKIYTRATAADVRLTHHLEPSIQTVNGSRLHLQRILENLINFALNDPGIGEEISVTSNQTYTDGGPLFYDTIEPGYYVVLSVEDQGAGIHPEDLDSIFQPFYSRRSETNDGNTGLGMSVVRAIVKQLRGGIDAISETGEGTRFDIYLPVRTPAN